MHLLDCGLVFTYEGQKLIVCDAGCVTVLDGIAISNQNANGEGHEGQVKKIQEG